MSSVRKLPDPGDRVETGTVQFGDDWPGVFIRGDTAAHYERLLSEVRITSDDPFAEVTLLGLRRLLGEAKEK